MENVTEIIKLIAANWDAVLIALSAIVGGIISIASIIVKITPSETDNEKLAKFIAMFEKLSLNSKSVEVVKKK